MYFFLASVVLFNGFRVEHGRWAVDLVNSDWNSSFQTATNPKGHLVERCLWCAGMCWEFPQHWRDTSARLPGRSGQVLWRTRYIRATLQTYFKPKGGVQCALRAWGFYTQITACHKNVLWSFKYTSLKKSINTLHE